MIALDCDIYMFCPKYQLPVSAILNDVLRAFVVNLLSRTLNFKKKKKKKRKEKKKKKKKRLSNGQLWAILSGTTSLTRW